MILIVRYVIQLTRSNRGIAENHVLDRPGLAAPGRARPTKTNLAVGTCAGSSSPDLSTSLRASSSSFTNSPTHQLTNSRQPPPVTAAVYLHYIETMAAPVILKVSNRGRLAQCYHSKQVANGSLSQSRKSQSRNSQPVLKSRKRPQSRISRNSLPNRPMA